MTKARWSPRRALGLVALLAPAACLWGCDSGGGGPAAPSPLEVRLSAPAVQVTRTITAEAVAVGRADGLTVTWLVDGVPGGSETSGVISQDNPATYTAPAEPPVSGWVVIEARLATDPSASGSDTLAVLFTIIHVDAEHGSDETGAGTWTTPLRTVTAGLGAATAGDTVLVRPGDYGPALGESPPYLVPSGVTLRGTHRDSCFLSAFGDGGVVVDLEDGAGVERVTIRNAGDDATGVLVAEAGRVRSIVANEPFLNAAIRSEGRGDTMIEDCRLENTAHPLIGRGMELISGSHATVRRCTLRLWYQGAFVNPTSDPRIEHSVFEDNAFGIDTWEINQTDTEPDLGGGERGSLGGNTIRGNASCGLANRTPGLIYAINNTWNVGPAEPPVSCQSVGDSCDICLTNGGAVDWCGCAGPSP